MRKFSNEAIEEIKSHLIDYIKETREFKGMNFSCFNSDAHSNNDKHPSAAIVPGTDNKVWKCFGCGESGDIFKAVKLNEGKDFKEALPYLADKYGAIAENTETTSYKASINKNEEVKDFSEEIDTFHKYVSQTSYYTNRGLSERIINKYKLGFHPIRKDFKYLLPVSNSFIIWRSDSIEKNGRYRNEGKTVPFNERYLLDSSLTKQYIFVTEGLFDALAFEELGYEAISINSVSNANKFIELVASNKENVKEKIFILSGDNDSKGIEMNEKLNEALCSIGIKSSIYNDFSKYKDVNEALIKDRRTLETSINKFIDRLESFDWSSYFKTTQKSSLTTTNNVNSEFGESVYILNNCYYKRTSSGGKAISNFTLTPVEVIQSDKVTVITFDAITNMNKKIRRKITLEDFMSAKSFKKAINHIDYCFSGSDNDLEYIKSSFSQLKYVEKTGLLHTGFHKVEDKWFFTSSDNTIDQSLNTNEQCVMIENHSELDTLLLKIKPIEKDELLKIAEAMFKFNTLKKTATILGYIAATFLKERLWKSSNIKFPHLLMIGEAGSGKSQTVESVIIPILGLVREAIGASKCTSFTTLKIASSSNTCPLIIEEYKPQQIGPSRVKDISNLLRDIYDHHTGTRGKADQTIQTYNLQCPVIMVGEAGTSETAIVERSLQVIFSKTDIKDSTFQNNFNLLKKNEKLLSKLGRALLNEALLISDDEIIKLYDTLYNDKVDSNINVPRVTNSVTCCLLGLSLIKRVFNRLQLDFGTTIDINEGDLIKAINSAAYCDLLGENSSSKSVIDQTLEVFDRMAENGLLVENIDYTIVKGSHLALRVNKFYDKFTKYVGDCRIEMEVLPQSQFTTQLRHASYFKNYDNARFSKYENGIATADSQKAYLLSIDALKQKQLELNRLLKGFI